MKKRSHFSSHMGFVLSAAGSAVGLGNIWRFPYLAAQYGGGIFLLVYLLLTCTFGYSMIITETALGRNTKKSPIGAFGHFGGKIKAGGIINAVIPILIVPYYSVIGGWVLKYLFAYFHQNPALVADGSYFSDFIGSGASVEFWFVAFTLMVILTIFLGVENGIERVSKLSMPVLVVLAVILSVYSMTREGAMAGVKYFLVPDFSSFSLLTIVAAMEQMFYSLSIAMGILVTFGSYIKDDVDIEKATIRVEIFDSLIAILAGLMIIPAVFAFSGGHPEALQAGPALMFITIPKVFASMGMGSFMGVLFFFLVLVAALTSAIALTESGVSTFEDELNWSRKKASCVMGIITIALGTLSSLGFNVLSGVHIIGMGFLDFFDFITNSIMMPIAAMCTCYLIIKIAGFDFISKEVKKSSPFKRENLYQKMMKFPVPLFLLIILLSSLAKVFGLVKV